MILSAFWLPATLAAALFQAWRTALQQRLRGTLSVNGAGLVRFLYGAPVAGLLLAGHLVLLGGGLPGAGAAFWGWVACGSLSQILGTTLLITAFGHRNFVVGTAYSKTDAVQGALLGSLLLRESLPPLAWLGVATGAAGVLTLSFAGRSLRLAELLRATVQPAALCGLGAGLGFAITGVFVKLAAADLGADAGAVRRSLCVLLAMNVTQAVVQGGWVMLREPGQLGAVLRGWRRAAPVGALSALGSLCWFLGFVLAPLGLVRAVGQVEILFTLLLGRFMLHERFTRTEVLGSLTIVAGVLLVLAGA